MLWGKMFTWLFAKPPAAGDAGIDSLAAVAARPPPPPPSGPWSGWRWQYAKGSGQVCDTGQVILLESWLFSRGAKTLVVPLLRQKPGWVYLRSSN